ncbi:succinylglutamate desuccinylase/aspartoacylase family protein [Sinorhizobium meliloti]|uniref:succinylglutamate desuccinylase/aspartoacylase family protein n=1 Tax=Rhizobium meliloti TaxID=382 RepID=UPI003D64E7CF
MINTSSVWSDVNLDREGRSFGYIRVPHSINDSGYGWIPVPIIVLKNGAGPSVLIMAGNHGDEYEGQVLLMKLAQNLSPEQVRGRLIILPGVNAPAVAAGTRISPIDDGNLNRLFPGDPEGTPTQMIAHFIDSVLLPQVRYCFDFHSGGYSLEYIPAAHLVAPDDADLRAEAIGFLKAFAMPNSILIEGLIGGGKRLLGSCRRLGAGHMSTELGGAGAFSIQAYRAAEKGLPRLLRHVGVLADTEQDTPPKTRFFVRQPMRDFVYAQATGVFEAYVGLGETVEAGMPAGAVHFTETPWRAPHPVAFMSSGVVLCKRSPARVKIGDCLFVTGTPVAEA